MSMGVTLTDQAMSLLIKKAIPAKEGLPTNRLPAESGLAVPIKTQLQI